MATQVKRLSPKRCVYINCKNYKGMPNISHFKFPVHDVQRAAKWQVNCGNVHVAALSIIELKQLTLCEAHFPRGFIIRNPSRKVLWKNAVPYKHDEPPNEDEEPTDEYEYRSPPREVRVQPDPANNVPTPASNVPTAANNAPTPTNSVPTATNNVPTPPLRTYQIKRAREGDNSSSNSSVNSDERSMTSKSSSNFGSEDSIGMRPSKLKPTRQRRKVLSKRIKMKCDIEYQNTYKSRKKSFSNFTIVNNLMRYASNSVKTFVMMQIFHKSNWTSSEKQLSLAIFHKSPSLYQFLLKNLKFRLPSLRTIQSWLKVANLNTGMATTLRPKLAQKANSMSDQEKMCVIMFDEISLKKKHRYNEAQDLIEGYQDLGQLGRENKLADTALVFLMRGLLYNWKIPLCYYTSSGTVKGSSLKYIIEYVIRHLRAMTFDPKVLVCRGNPNNRIAMSFLGATQEEPVITVDNKNVFTCFDVPHLIISLRDDFMGKKMNFVVNKKLVCWKDVVETYKIDKDRIPRVLEKIKDSHIYPNDVEKMRVRYAAQIFSRTVSLAMINSVRMFQLESCTALDTAEFIENVNSLFDVLNSKVIYDDNQKKSALSIYDDSTEQVLLNALSYFDDIEVFELDTKTECLHSLKGLTWSIRSILLLWAELKDLGIQYLLTSCLNQEPLQILFNCMRSTWGYNPTPTVRQCRLAMQNSINARLQMSTGASNCYMEESDLVDISLSERFLDEHESVVGTSGKRMDVGEHVQNVDNSQNPNLPSTSKAIPPLETCTTTYIAAYLIMNILRETVCEYCIASFRSNSADLVDAKEILLLVKNYGCRFPIRDLKKPSDQFTEIVAMSQRLFNMIYVKHKFGPNVRENIVSAIDGVLRNSEHGFWFKVEGNPECLPHRKGIIRELVKMKIHRTLQWEAEVMNQNTTSAKRQRKM